jgi:hypothetical protein
MLVYVVEENLIYQYSIPNYDTLWAGISGQTNVTNISDYTTTVNSRSQEGRNFISAWTGSTIEGVNGVSRDNARWKIFNGSYPVITGGTYTGDTLVFTTNTGSEIEVTGVTTGQVEQ